MRGVQAKLVAFGALVALALAGAGASSAVAASPRLAPHLAGAEPQATIKVAQFNSDISDEYPQIPATLVARAIRASGADVVGIEEGGGEIPQIAQALGWQYYDVRMQIVSRLPLIDPPQGNGLFTYVEVSPGRVAALENVHLPSNRYGPNMIRRGATAAEVLAVERKVRVPAVKPDLVEAKKLMAQGIPVFLTGDFNSPSFRDWTKATVGLRPELKFPLRWPASLAVEKAGFTDSFRAVYPDPVTVPGLTWPTHRTYKHTERFANAPKDRIDFVFSHGATPVASNIIGEPGAPGITKSISPWPSDHRLVVSTFTLDGATPPTLVTVPQRLVVTGTPLPVSFHADGAAKGTIVIKRLDPGPAAVVAARHVQGTDLQGLGTETFASDLWTPGAYEVLLRSGSQTLSTFPFWVEAPGTPPAIYTSSRTFAVGDPVVVNVRNAPGERWDWLGIYTRGANPNVAPYLMWSYTSSAIDGQISLGPYAHGHWPLPAGKYTVYLLRDDMYVTMARADFRIR